MKKKPFSHSYWDRVRLAKAMEWDDIDTPEPVYRPEVADSETVHEVPGEVILARAVVETALREVLGDYSDTSKAFSTPTSQRESTEFFLSDDCLWWIRLAGGTDHTAAQIREMIRGRAVA